MRILLVEDEPKMAELVRRVLAADQHAVDLAGRGAEALALAAGGTYEVVILDRMLPDLDGLEVLGRLRAAGVETPVLLLTALGSVEHRVDGLDAGADDYLAKPFAFAELLARVRALGRRGLPEAGTVLAVGDLALDEPRRRVSVGERGVDLSAREYALLDYLMRHPGQVLTRRQILDAVWGTELEVAPGVVDLYVHYLRRKLRAVGRPDRLQTVRGVGYQLRAEA